MKASEWKCPHCRQRLKVWSKENKTVRAGVVIVDKQHTNTLINDKGECITHHYGHFECDCCGRIIQEAELPDELITKLQVAK